MTPPSSLPSSRDDAARQVYRANAAYEIVPFDRLSVTDQAGLAELARDPQFFGVLRPRDPAVGSLKAISRDAALLVYALQSPGPIPRRAVGGDDHSIVDAAWRLTLDGILEIERDGVYVSGAAAVNATTEIVPRGTVARLSFDALRFVSCFDGDDPIELGYRLYRFNRRPITPRWAARLHTPGDVLRFAGASSGSPTAAALEQHWKTKAPEQGDPWVSWWPRREARTPRRAHDAAVTFKLYVSPRTEDLATAFPRMVRVLADAGAPPFKIGASVSGVLRPDKLVAYFTSREAAEECAAAIVATSTELPAHPVPFTHDLGGDGFVSLGIDPPTGRAMLQQVGASWRLWICRRLASYICVARRSGRAADADRFARERIALDGIDPSTWEPSETAVRGFAAGSTATA